MSHKWFHQGRAQLDINFYENVCSMLSDCGAGIGRVTKNLLLPLFDTVDLVEQNPDFVEKAKEYIVSECFAFVNI